MYRNRWFNYLIGGALGLLLVLTLSKALWPIFNILLNNSDDIIYFLGVNLTFFPIIISVTTVILLYHRFSIKKIYYKRIFTGFALWFILQMLSLLITFIFDKNSIELNFNSEKFFIFLLLSLIFTPIQIAAEEFIFRGYLLSALRSVKKSTIIPLILSAILFAIPHMSNPEVQTQKAVFFLVYFTMAMLLGYLTIKYSGIEYAMGIHFANNFFAINILNYPDSPLPSSPLFLLQGNVEPIPSLIQTVILAVIIITFIKKIELFNAK